MNFKYITCVALATMIPLLAHANEIDTARVLEANPIYRTVRINTPRQECWTEEVSHAPEQSSGVGGMIVGGLVGGALGSRVGKGNGNKAAIGAGALIGGAIGQNMAQNNSNNSNRGYTTQEQRCQMVDNFHEESRTEGYKVKYIYNGRVYHTQTQSHPGDSLQVRVSVTPVL